MPHPCATYRIQFNLNFRFRDAEELVPYLHALGVTHLYASPRFPGKADTLADVHGRGDGQGVRRYGVLYLYAADFSQ